MRLRNTPIILLIALGMLISVPSFASASVPHAATPPKGIPVLMYHQLGPKEISLRSRHNVLVTPEVFEEQLAYLKKAGYTTITCGDLADYLIDKKPLPTRPILLTFDDGWRSNYLYAFPLLKKYEMKATVFLITAMMGHEEALSDPVQAKAGLGLYLVWPEITEMAASGLVNFESHTNNLHFATKNRIYGMDAVSKDFLEEDLVLASERIENATGHRPVALAYPYGHYKKAYKVPMEKAGIRIAFTTREGEVNAGDNPLELNRITIYPFHRDLSRVLRGRQLRITRF